MVATLVLDWFTEGHRTGDPLIGGKMCINLHGQARAVSYLLTGPLMLLELHLTGSTESDWE